MPDLIPAYVTASRLDRYARNGLADEAEDNREDLERGLVALVSALRFLRDAGDSPVVPGYLSELAKLAHDGISRRDAELRSSIDDAGRYAEPIDLSELQQLTTEGTWR